MSMKVINPGALTTVQDRGRFGYQSKGVRVCGVMDAKAYSAAIERAGGKDGDAVLEMTLFGGTYVFEDETAFALSGADMDPQLNGKPCPMDSRISAKAGDKLDLGFAKAGCRTYLAVAGGIDVPEVMGSRSTDVKCAIGGMEGRALRAGDVVPVGAAEALKQPAVFPERRTFPDEIVIRAIPGPQDDMFTRKGLETFFGTPYLVSENSDRMGYRLAGEKVESINGTDIISDGIVFGSVQITAEGLPIILMADRQTTGGYAKIATVISADLPLLAQARPGNTVRFKKVNLEDIR
ncbi:MAG: biotin-dependent carboxyltransferase family protein [Clostridia bacterium]|nr:biotin-dependent carboxyltransferase family protein [Clostridia bacterium]